MSSRALHRVACHTEGMEFFVRVLGNAAGLWIASALIEGITLAADSNDYKNMAINLLIIGLLLALVNSLVKPIVKVLSFPLYLLTFGLFALVVNGAMLMFTSWLTDQASLYTDYPVGLHVDSLWVAIFGSILIAMISAIIVGIFGPDRD